VSVSFAAPMSRVRPPTPDSVSVRRFLRGRLSTAALPVNTSLPAPPSKTSMNAALRKVNAFVWLPVPVVRFTVARRRAACGNRARRRARRNGDVAYRVGLRRSCGLEDVGIIAHSAIALSLPSPPMSISSPSPASSDRRRHRLQFIVDVVP
jgi:hypothetical protein